MLRESSLEVKDIPIDLFVTNDDNINEMSDDDLKKLSANISEVGFISPVEVVPTQDGKYLLLGGEHRWKAAQFLGMTYIPAVILTDSKWTDDDLLQLTAFRLNNIKGTQNPEKFIKLYEKLAIKFGAESLKDVFAVTDKSLWKKLTKSIKADLKKSGMPTEVLDQADKIDQKSKDFNQFTKSMNKLFSDQTTKLTSGCVLFSMGNSEHLVIQANKTVFDSMKALSSLASSQEKNINDYLEEVLLSLLRDLK